MNQQDYLKSLRSELEQRKVAKIHEILADYQEHFTQALQSGKSESEVVEKLGLPELIAKAYETEAFITQSQAIGKGIQWGLVVNSVGRLFIIAPFNFFFLFIPAIIIGALLFAGWAVSVGIAAMGLGLLAILPGILSSAETIWALVATLSTSLGILGIAGMGSMIMYGFTKYIALAVINYLQWNIKFIVAK